MVRHVNNMGASKDIGLQKRTVATLKTAARSAVDSDAVLGQLPDKARRFISDNIYASFVTSEIMKELKNKDA